jgi:pimeloyl-ACP methyl ester carboxylesterase
MKRKIFIFHGWTYSASKWQPLTDLLNKSGIETIMLKVPGLTAPLQEVWDLDNYVEWLNKELAHEKEKVVLLGHSNGGRIILAYTAKYPDKVEQLILIDSAGIYHNEPGIRIKRFIFGNLAKFGKKFSNSETLRKLLYKFTRESDYEKANPVLRETMLNLIRTDISYLFPVIHVPTTIIWGERDTTTPLADGKNMKQALRNGALYIISGARHSPMFTNVEEVGEIIRKVVSRKEIDYGDI